MYPETQPLNVYNRLFGGALPTGTDPAQAPGPEAVACSISCASDLARMQTLIPAQREGPAGRAHADRDHAARGEHPADVRHVPNTAACTKPATPPTYANTSTGQ